MPYSIIASSTLRKNSKKRPPQRMSRKPREYKVEVLNHRARIDARWVVALCKKILAAESSPSAQVNIVATDNRYIRQLNRDYRGVNRATDVLAFNLRNQHDSHSGLLLGEIYLSCEKARRQAVTYGHSLRDEVRKLVAHGLLHLLGYDHKQESRKDLMENKEKLYLSEGR